MAKWKVSLFLKENIQLFQIHFVCIGKKFKCFSPTVFIITKQYLSVLFISLKLSIFVLIILNFQNKF